MAKGFSVIFIILGLFIIFVLLASSYNLGKYFRSQKIEREFSRIEPPPIKIEPPVSTPSSELCIQVITPARNPKTGECKDFGTPCSVPSGWEKVKSCIVWN